jgi:hypothetical protein
MERGRQASAQPSKQETQEKFQAQWILMKKCEDMSHTESH